jgi:hypothetical protein
LVLFDERSKLKLIGQPAVWEVGATLVRIHILDDLNF